MRSEIQISVERREVLRDATRGAKFKLEWGIFSVSGDNAPLLLILMSRNRAQETQRY